MLQTWELKSKKSKLKNCFLRWAEWSLYRVNGFSGNFRFFPLGILLISAVGKVLRYNFSITGKIGNREILMAEGLQYVKELLCNRALIGLIACFQGMSPVGRHDVPVGAGSIVDDGLDLARYNFAIAVSKKRYQHFKANHSCYFRQAPEISLESNCKCARVKGYY